MKKSKYISLGFKFSLMVFIMIFLSASVMGVTSFLNHKKSVIELAGKQALGVAQSVALSIDGDEFKKIDNSNQKTKYFHSLLSYLSNVKKESNFAFVYTMVEEDANNYKYIVDGILPGQTDDISELGDIQSKDDYGEEPIIALSGEGTTSDIYYNGEDFGYLISAFYPIYDSHDAIVGIVGVDIRANDVLAEAKSYIPMIAIFILVSSIILFLMSLFFIRKNISIPLKILMDASNKLSIGDTKVSIVQKSKDEMGQLMGAFGRMVQNIEHQADNLQKIAQGDLAVQIEKKSENDVLAESMITVVDNLKNLDSEIKSITKSVTEGELSKRANNNCLKGDYKEFIDGINDILDSFINVLDSIEAGILIVDKEYNLKFANLYSFDEIADNRESIIGHKCYEVYSCDRSLCKYDLCVKEQKKQSFDEVDNLTNVNYQTDMLPYNDKDGTTRGIIEVNIDISEVKKAEKIAQKQLEYQENEIDKVVDNLTSLANGNLDIQTSVSESDADTKEIAQNFIKLNSSLLESTSAIKLMIDEVSDILFKMSKKDFSNKIETSYVGDFTKLKDSINYIVDQFNMILTEINTAAEQVEAGAEQVASSSQGLSQGASEQASSVEEIGATVTEVANQTNENAINANKANELSIKAKEGAQVGNDQMQSMLLAMNEITDSSKNIANIIKVIEEIAFQTNILALNAAVEAARAGEHGKGFAVVAEEVRNLAARSAKAAKETTDLIDNSIHKVNEGYDIANDTAVALYNIVNGVTDTVDIVSKIAEASNQQATAISEINRGIEQVSEVTQSNTATAEESASASQEMADQAQTLKSMMKEFKLQGKYIKKPKKISSMNSTRNNIVEGAIDINLNDNSFGKY